MATVGRVVIATQFEDATDGIVDCVAMAMCLIVAPFSPFLIEVHVCWLLYHVYCVVYSQCKITQLEKQDN